MAKRASLSKSFVWVILALLVLGLAGFGATNLSGTIRTVGHVGDKSIDVEDYGRDLQQEIRAVEAQTGQTLPFDQALAIGLDRAVLARLITTRALDNEAAQLGVSVGDENLREQIVQIPAFRGPNGQFDREGYRFLIQQQGMTEAQFESKIRDDSSRALLQAAMIGGITMPDAFVDVLLNYVGQQRSFEWARLGRSELATALPVASDADIDAYYAKNIDLYALPADKQISYILLTPDMILDEVAVDEVALQQLYEERTDAFNQPERRLVERLAFADETTANAAKAALEVSGTSFEALVGERGLSLADIDLGDVAKQDLDGASDLVFSAEVGDIVGPAPSPLGPALFRVNGILPAITTDFEEARPELQEELAADRARRLIETKASAIDDLLAGGATLEEVATETEMELGRIDWHEGLDDGIAAYSGFGDAAAALGAQDFPFVIELDDGGIFAMRLDGELPSRPAPLEDVRRRVIADWENQELLEGLDRQANDLLPQLQNGASFADLSLQVMTGDNLIRSDFVEGTSPDFLNQVFEMNVGDVRVVESQDAVLIVRLGTIADPEETTEMKALRTGLRTQVDQALAQDMFDVFARDVQLRAKPQIDQRAVNAVNAGFR
jgi:peptidyl-prolyl cis-trans isomerase D